MDLSYFCPWRMSPGGEKASASTDHMKKILFRILPAMLALLCCFSAGAKHKNFKVSIYVRAYEVEKMKDTQWLESTWKTISSQLYVDKINLETHRDMLLVDDATLDKA